MMSTIAIFFTACAALWDASNDARNIGSAAYCALFSSLTEACTIGTEQAARTGRVLEAIVSSNASGFFGTALAGVPSICSLPTNPYSLTSRPDCLVGIRAARGQPGRFFICRVYGDIKAVGIVRMMQ